MVRHDSSRNKKSILGAKTMDGHDRSRTKKIDFRGSFCHFLTILWVQKTHVFYKKSISGALKFDYDFQEQTILCVVIFFFSQNLITIFKGKAKTPLFGLKMRLYGTYISGIYIYI